MPTRYEMRVTGLREVMDALGEIDKTAQRKIEREIRKAGRSVVSAAQRNVIGRPLANWGTWFEPARGRDLSFEPSNVRSQIKVRKNNFRRRGVSYGLGFDVQNMSPGGSIFEVIGDASRVSGPQGQLFVQQINERYPSRQPRLLFNAYYEGMPADLRDRIAEMIVDEARKAGLR